MRIVFAGTPEFGLPCLEAIHASQHQLIAVYTQPDRPAGRGQTLQESAVKTWGLSHQLPIYQPLNFKSPEVIANLEALAPDVMVVIAYGLILPQKVLDIPRLGCINVHASILPRWRGAAPIQNAILAGDLETGITIMHMDSGMDTGDILAIETCPIAPQDTSLNLQHKLSILATKPLLTSLQGVMTHTLQAIAQNHAQATYAPKIHKQDAAIDWREPASLIDQKIRAYYPWPIAFTQSSTQTIRIHQARIVSEHYSQSPGTIISMTPQGMLVATGNGAILIERMQCPGGRPMSLQDFLNANRNNPQVGSILK